MPLTLSGGEYTVQPVTENVDGKEEQFLTFVFESPFTTVAVCGKLLGQRIGFAVAPHECCLRYDLTVTAEDGPKLVAIASEMGCVQAELDEDGGAGPVIVTIVEVGPGSAAPQQGAEPGDPDAPASIFINPRDPKVH